LLAATGHRGTEPTVPTKHFPFVFGPVTNRNVCARRAVGRVILPRIGVFVVTPDPIGM
jgi:hypothetical protein